MLSGVYPAGQYLPGVKELCGRYGVCAATLRKSLAGLAGSQCLVLERKRYRVPLPAGSPVLDTVVLVARGYGEGDPLHGRLMLSSPLLEERLRAFEAHCAQSRIRLVGMPCFYRGQELVVGHSAGDTPEKVCAQRAVLGFAVWTGALSQPGSVPALVQRIARLGKPVAVLVESASDADPVRPTGRAPVRVLLAADNVRVGREAGDFLIGLGHRSVAFISAAHETGWSVERQAGLSAAFESAGIPGGVLACTITAGPARPGAWPLPGIRSSLDRVAPLNVEGRDPEDEAVAEALRRAEVAIQGALERRSLAERIAPLLDSAAQRPEITAWVAANDATALVCLDWLKRAGRRVPGDISVMGFDNTDESLLAGLTSYDFNAGAAVHAMLTHITSPGNALLQGMPESCVAGFINVRGTTGPPR